MTDRRERIFASSLLLALWLAAVLGLLYVAVRFAKWVMMR